MQAYLWDIIPQIVITAVEFFKTISSYYLIRLKKIVAIFRLKKTQ